MSWKAITLAFCIAIGLQAPLSAEDLNGDVERGSGLFRKKCFACHSLDTDRVGPRLRGVVGRTAGSLPAFSYSPALTAFDEVWTRQSLDLWLAGPGKYLPGARMPIALRRDQDRRDVIAYLVNESSKAKTND